MCPQFSLCFITCRRNNKASFLLRIWLFLWHKILLEKLVVTQLLTKSLPYMEQKGASGCIKSSVILQEKAQLIKTLEVYKEVHIVNYLCRYWTKSLTYLHFWFFEVFIHYYEFQLGTWTCTVIFVICPIHGDSNSEIHFKCHTQFF
jgi:hypothetical protein